MSYILEALKKLEEKRRRAETPHDLLTIPAATAPDGERRPLWHYLIAVLLLFNAGLLLWWLLRPWQAPAGAGLKAEPSPSPSLVYEPEPGKEKYARKIRPDSTAPDKEAGTLRQTQSPAVDVLPAETARVTRKTAEKDARKIYGLDELPPSVRQELPQIIISGHFYAADPSSRVAVINGKAMHEGETLTGGLRLERITSDGVVMDYQGYCFRKGLF